MVQTSNSGASVLCEHAQGCSAFDIDWPTVVSVVQLELIAASVRTPIVGCLIIAQSLSLVLEQPIGCKKQLSSFW